MFNRSVNKVVLVGNIGKDPEMRYLPNGNAVANISIATTESWKDKQTGERVDKTEWHRLSVFNRLGEMCGEYLKKGNKIYAEGKLQTRKWQDQDGQDRYSTDVVVSEIQLLDSKSQGDNGQPQQQQSYGNAPQQAPAQQAAPQMAPAYQQQAAPQAAPQHKPQLTPAQARAQQATPQQTATQNNAAPDDFGDIPF